MINFIKGQEHFDNSKSRDLIELKCDVCEQNFFRKKHHIQISICNYKKRNHPPMTICSKKCQNIHQDTSILIECHNCHILSKKDLSSFKKSKNHFCSQSCAAFYNNLHKTKGFQRSKLELYLEGKLPQLYPTLEFKFNDRETIGAELDIFIPSLKLAFELNGIFHYEPIFGLEKLTTTQKTDKQKMITCYNNNIELCVLDTTSLKYFKEKNAQKFLDIITNIINSKFLPK